MSEEVSNPQVVPYLPKVRTDIRPPTTSGSWENNPVLLSRLPQNLSIDEIPETTSIPSVWARALVFEEALRDANHPQHKVVQNEWRGLMGIFCFRGCFGLNLDITGINFNPPTDRLTNSLFIQKPDGWPDKIYLLKVDSFLMGGSSPSTLFFTPPEYECSKFVPWYENGRLYDPLTYFDNVVHFDEEKKILKAWINIIINYFSGRVGGDVIQPFIRWINEMDNVQSDPNITFQSGRIDIEASYGFVNTYFSWNRTNGDFFLKVSEGRNQKSPIVIWERGGWDKGGRVFNSWHYVNFGEKNRLPDAFSGEYLSDERIWYPWIRPEKLFLTDSILLLPTISTNVISVYDDDTGDKFRQYLPPLRRKILDYFSPEDLKERLKMEDAPGGGVKVTLTLPLTNGQFLPIFKTYNQEQIITILEPDLRPFEVWPDFSADQWDKYYCIYGQIKNLETEPWVYSSPHIVIKHENRDHSLVIWEISKYPDAILFNHNHQESGLILLNSPQKIQNFGIVWDVAVDLGTITTTVFYRQGAQEARPVEFKNRCVQVIETGRELRETFLNKLFFSPKNFSGAFSTSFIKFTPQKTAVLDPIIDGQVPLGTSQEWFIWMEKHKDLPILLQDALKWSKDEVERNCLYVYMKHLILRITAEATANGVNQINLKWAYPSAFSDDMKISLSSAFTSLPNWLGNSISVNVDPKGETESVAVCRYFEDVIYPGRVIADIGGGTSDIGIWRNKEIVFQTSILLAGKVLIDYINGREDLRKDVLLSLSLPVEEASLNYFTEKCAHCFNNLLMEYHTKLYSLFTTNKALAEGYKQARSIIFLIFSGISYHTGLILKEITIPPCDIWLAGNGSRLINLVNAQAISYLKKFLPHEIKIVDIKPSITPKQEIARGLLSDLSLETTPTPKVIIGEDGYKFGGKEVRFDQELTLSDLEKDEIEVPKSYPHLSQFLEIYNECAHNLELVPLEITKDLNLKIWQEISGRINILKDMVQNHIKRRKPYRGLIQPFFVEELRFVIEKTLYKKQSE